MTTPATETPTTPTRPLPRVAKELLASNGFLLARLGFGFKARAIAKLDQADCEIYDYSVLAVLAEGVSATQATIAGTLGLDPSRLVTLLDSLEKRGLIVRQRDPQDRRRHTVAITPAGTEELTSLRRIVKELEEEFLAPLDAETRDTLHQLLMRLAVHNDPRCALGLDVPAAPAGD